MKQLEFIKCMKYLCSCYSRKIDNNTLTMWFKCFDDVSCNILLNAIEEIVNESIYFPSISQLKNKCTFISNNQVLNIINKMKDNGYFKKGYKEELSDIQASRNYEKALLWLEKGTLPHFLQDDIKRYSTKLITNDNRLIE